MQFMLARKDEMHLAPERNRGPTYDIVAITNVQFKQKRSGSEVIKMDQTNGFCE